MDDRPLAIELFAGMFGWGEGLVSAGWRVIGVDILHEPYHGKVPEGCSLVLQDVCTLHGAQFKDAHLIVASPPCQEFSYRAMPWKRAKALPPPLLGTNLFWQCWRIQQEACEAAGRYIPMVVENVKGAQKWIGRAKGRYGSFFIWGDVENIGGRLVRSGPVEFGMESVAALRRSVMKNGVTHRSNGATNFHDGRKLPAGHDTFKANGKPCNKLTDPRYGSAKRQEELIAFVEERYPELLNGVKNARNWWSDGAGSLSATTSSKSSARKAASAQIAKIPFPLSSFVGRVFYPSK